MTPIIKTIRINAPASKVWEALSDPDKLGEWITMPNNIKPEIGHEFTFDAKNRDKKGEWDKIIRCKITELIPQEFISYTWSSNPLNGETLVSFRLKEENGNTELTLTHSGWENLPEDGEMWREGHNNGWNELLDNLIKIFNQK